VEVDMGCTSNDLEIVYKDSLKSVPERLYKYFIDHPEEAKEKLVIMCRNCQRFHMDNR
jgi:hypothetical protein